MNKKIMYKAAQIIMLMVCLGIMGSSVMAGSKQPWKLGKVNLNDLTPVEFEGQATYINPTDGFLVVGQTKVPVVENQSLKSGESITTVIVDENGNRIPMSQIKEFNRVLVNGYKSRAGFLFAEKIQRKPLKDGDKKGASSVPE